MGDRMSQCFSISPTCIFPAWGGIKCPIGYTIIGGSCCYAEYCGKFNSSMEEVKNLCAKWYVPTAWDWFLCTIWPPSCDPFKLLGMYCEQWRADYYYQLADPNNPNNYLVKGKPNVIACQVANVDGEREAGFDVL